MKAETEFNLISIQSDGIEKKDSPDLSKLD